MERGWGDMMKRITLFFILLLIVASVAIGNAIGNNTVVQTVTVLAPPSVTVELTPDDDPVTPGVQVINPDSSTNKSVNITATVSDGDGYSNIVSVIANITGPSVVEDSPVNLSFDSVVNVTTAVYTCSFNVSNHTEGDYKVEVRATDFGGLTGVGSRNFAYLYRVTVTTYDFATGAGIDKWAFRKEHNVTPPVTNDVPNIEFTSREYGRISRDDHKMQRDSTRLSGYYAVHRFKFDIAEPVGSVAEIEVLWNGAGTHTDKNAVKGTTLYIWNWTFNSGAYEQLDMTTIKKEVYLSGKITENVGNYIDTTGNLTILVKQNPPQGGKASKISTDYVKVDITTHLSLSSKSASTSEKTGNSWLDRVHQGGVALFRWLLGG